MKALAIQNSKAYNQNLSRIYLEKQNQIPDLFVDQPFYDAVSKQTHLFIYSSMFRTDNLELKVKGDHLHIVLSEHIEFNNPYHRHHYHWKMHNQKSYDRFHSVSVMLGAVGYHVVNQDFDESKGLLRVTLVQNMIN